MPVHPLPLNLHIPVPVNLLDEVRTAIRIERRGGLNAVQMRVDGVFPVPSTERLFHLVVQTDAPLRPRDLRIGARALRELTDGEGGAPWSGAVVEVSGNNLWVRAGSVDPCTGPARLLPFDFLAAPHQWLNAGASVAVLPEFERRLMAASGQASGVRIAASQPEGPWNTSWGVVWGPPGTGKTFQLGQQVARLLQDPGERVLVIAPTNQAADGAAHELGGHAAAAGVPLGCIKRVGTVNSGDFLGPRTAMLPAELHLHRELEDMERDHAGETDPELRALIQERVDGLRQRIPGFSEHSGRADVRCIVTTRFTAVRQLAHDGTIALLERGRPPFTTVVIDEAGLVGRALTAVASMLASRRVMLVGDPCQLSPIVQQARSMPTPVRRWLANSALEHLNPRDRPVHVHFLDQQRRMHPDIASGISALMYGGRLVSHDDVRARDWSRSGELRHLPRLTWYVVGHGDVVPKTEVTGEAAPGGSRVRRGTRRVLHALVQRHPELRTQKILFVTPYRGQARAARTWLDELGLRAEASTVHRQQGNEADVVIFDTVHASSLGWVDREWRRMVNVGVSRARHLCVLIASEDEMRQPWFAPLRRWLAPRVLRRRGEALQWSDAQTRWHAQTSLLAVQESTPEEVTPIVGDRLGDQLAARGALVSLLSAEQKRLVDLDLTDGGARLVRGVAGSGKTLVLVHWAVRLLLGARVPAVDIVFANAALEPMLRRMLHAAWRHRTEGRRPFPQDRVRLHHIRDLLLDELKAAGLPAPIGDARWDYESQAAAVLSAGVSAERFAALLVDEAQDLGHEPLRLLVSRVTSVDGKRLALVFFDNAQNVYGRRAPVWKDIGIDVRGARSTVMRESFRSTRAITECALDVLDRLRPLEQDADLRELMQLQPPLLSRGPSGWRAEFARADGEQPRIELFADRQQERQAIEDQLAAWVGEEGVSPADIRVLVPRTRLGEKLAQELNERLPFRVLWRTSQGFDDGAEAVVVTTPHSFKGYDAEIVVVSGATHFEKGGELWPAPLYVAMTRARTLLWVTGTLDGDPRLIEALTPPEPPAAA